MCGIAGILRFNRRPVEVEEIKRATDAMQHRGPDDGSFINEGPLALGHRRLSIIDLSEASNQPFTDNSGRYTMVFNGEMYNYSDVKSALPDYRFHTTGDTEVLLAAFTKWGPDCINLFKGMFAFAVWDRQEEQLTLMRDRFGVKPLYYFHGNESFVFASEIRAILATAEVKRKVDAKALQEFFSYQSIGYPFGAVNSVQQVEAGSYLTVKNGKIDKKVYWDVTKTPVVNFDFNNVPAIHKKIRELLSGSVERRLVSDVPVGAFLSGGIDSSAVVGLMAETGKSSPNTFTIGFEEQQYDESAYAEIVARKFKTSHTRILLKPTVFLDELENALNAMDIPSADGINTYVVSKNIRAAGIKVALSGIGGDELFAGYPLFNQFVELQKRRIFFRNTGFIRKTVAAIASASNSNRNNRIQQILASDLPDIQNVYPVFRQILSPGLLRKLTSFSDFNMQDTGLYHQLSSKHTDIDKYPLLSQVSIAEYLGYTQHTLLKDTDQMSMACSLEVREPFFDHDLAEFVLAIPDKIKTPTYSKSLLVESLKPLLPDEIVHRPKQGFVFPWSNWMKKELFGFCEERINRLGQRSFINGKELKLYWKRFLANDKSVRWPELWMFVVLEHWLEKNEIND